MYYALCCMIKMNFVTSCIYFCMISAFSALLRFFTYNGYVIFIKIFIDT